MYAQFFGLSQAPFSIAPDPRYLFMSERHREALAHLLYGLGGGGGFVLLSGEIGTGKTTVCRCFLEQVPTACNVAYIFNPKLTVEELLKSVCGEFHIDYQHMGPGLPTVKDYVDALNGFLLRTHGLGWNNVLIIDEAQNLSADVLEQLRLLTNLETNERKLLQIILIGQPELRTMLARPELEQLAQRVVARFHLDALTEEESQAYIQHRLAVAGLVGASPFDRKALKRIHQLTRGVPRRINLLCDRAMLGAYATGQAVIDKAIVNKAASEVFEQPGFAPRDDRKRSPWALLGLGVVAGAVIAGGAAVMLRPELLAPTPLPLPAAKKKALPASAAMAVAAAASAAASSPAIAASTAASTAVGAAPAASAASAAVALTPFDLKAGLSTLARSESDAWRELGRAWSLHPAEGDPCEAAQSVQVHCFKKNGDLALLRRLARPAILTLQDGGGPPAYALLTGLGDANATLRVGTATHPVPLATLEGLWRGDYATFWRAPPGYVDKIVDGNSGPSVDWLAARLATADGTAAPQGPQKLGPRLKARLQAFQQAQGLAPDGRAGPLTFMQLNRATGVDEPRLTTSP